MTRLLLGTDGRALDVPGDAVAAAAAAGHRPHFAPMNWQDVLLGAVPPHVMV